MVYVHVLLVLQIGKTNMNLKISIVKTTNSYIHIILKLAFTAIFSKKSL